MHFLILIIIIIIIYINIIIILIILIILTKRFSVFNNTLEILIVISSFILTHLLHVWFNFFDRSSCSAANCRLRMRPPSTLYLTISNDCDIIYHGAPGFLFLAGSAFSLNSLPWVRAESLIQIKYCQHSKLVFKMFLNAVFYCLITFKQSETFFEPPIIKFYNKVIKNFVFISYYYYYI